MDWWNLDERGSRNVVGEGIEKKFGQSVSTTPASLRWAFDEVVKKMAFDWKVNHEGYSGPRKRPRTWTLTA